MRNKIVGGLILATGLFFVSGIFIADENLINAKIKLYQLAVISGFSAIATRFLIKEKNNE